MIPTRFGSTVPCETVADAGGEILLHHLSPLVVAGIEELLAVPGGASEVRLKDGVAAVGEELRDRIVAPGVAGHDPVQVDRAEDSSVRRPQESVRKAGIA